MNPEKEATDVPKEEAAELTKYELMMIFVPDMSQEETDKELEAVRKELKKLKAEIYHEDIWDVRDLAYEIKKYDKGYYVIFYFTLEDSSKLSDLEKDFVLNLKVLRHLLVKSPKGYQLKPLEELMAKSEIKQGPPKKEETVVLAKKEEPKVEETVKEEPKKEEKAEESAKEEPKVEEKVEEAPAEKAPEKEEEKTMDISDLDSKLESILDDPDIDIKL